MSAQTYAPSSTFDFPKSTDQILAEVRLREQREGEARDARIRARYAELAERWYVDAVEERYCDHDEMPNRYDGVRVWEDLVLADDARAPLGGDMIINELKGADEFLESYPRTVMTSLSAVLEVVERRRAEAVDRGREAEAETEARAEASAGGGEKGKRVRKGKGNKPWKWPADPEEALRHPTALFRCGGCSDYAYAWPRINGHWRERHPDESVWTTRKEDEEVETVFNAEVWEEGMELAERILTTLIDQGLQKNDRDGPHLDDLIQEGRVFCPCGDPTMATPVEGLNWAALVSDCIDSHVISKPTFIRRVWCR